MKIPRHLIKKGPGVEEKLTGSRACLCLMCQPVSKILIGFGLTVFYQEDRLLLLIAERVKGNVCCLEKEQTI